MSAIEDFLKEQAEKQLDKASKAVDDGEWFDALVKKMNAVVDKGIEDPDSGLNPEVGAATKEAIKTLEANKDKVVGLGSDAFTLMVSQIASGKEKDAANTYVQALDRGTYGLIEAKKQIDDWWDNAWVIIKDIAIKGAQYLLPLLLAL